LEPSFKPGERDAVKLLSFFCSAAVPGTRKLIATKECREGSPAWAGWQAKGGAVLTFLWHLFKPSDNPVEEFAVDDAQYYHRSVSYPIKDPEVTGSQPIDRRPEIL